VQIDLGGGRFPAGSGDGVIAFEHALHAVVLGAVWNSQDVPEDDPKSLRLARAQDADRRARDARAGYLGRHRRDAIALLVPVVQWARRQRERRRGR
jgi:hypothetical protein